MREALEINGPTGEEPNEDVKRDEAAEDDGGVNEVEAREDRGEPRAVENSEGPNVEAPRQLLLAQQIDVVHHLAADVEARHCAAAEESVPAGEIRNGVGLNRRLRDELGF